MSWMRTLPTMATEKSFGVCLHMRANEITSAFYFINLRKRLEIWKCGSSYTHVWFACTRTIYTKDVRKDLTITCFENWNLHTEISTHPLCIHIICMLTSILLSFSMLRTLCFYYTVFWYVFGQFMLQTKLWQRINIGTKTEEFANLVLK